jgi:tRNA threonylcarbamoyladenosine biosynthesis protein TsaE
LKVKHLKYLTNSDKETVRVGERLGTRLAEGDVVALTGELGSGKTWFTKGIALGLGIGPDTIITSPSFSLVNEYDCGYVFYHMDLFRLENLSEVLSAGLEEYLHGKGIVVIEWADRCPEILPEMRVDVQLEIVDDHRRDITIIGRHRRALEILEGLKAQPPSPLRRAQGYGEPSSA